MGFNSALEGLILGIFDVFLVVFRLIEGVNYGKLVGMVYHCYQQYYILLIMTPPPGVINLRNPSVSNPFDPQLVPFRHTLILMCFEYF